MSAHARASAGTRRVAWRTTSSSTSAPAAISAATPSPGRCSPGIRPALSAHTVSANPSAVSATVSAASVPTSVGQVVSIRRRSSTIRSASPPRADSTPDAPARRDPREQHVAAPRVTALGVRRADGGVPAAPTGKLRAEVQHHARDHPQGIDVPEGQAPSILPGGARRSGVRGAARRADLQHRARQGRRPANLRSTALPVT